MTSIAGFWSDGTANADVALSLRNEGRLPYEETQRIAISCARNDSPIEGCGGTTEIALPDGFSAGESNLTLRLPMGNATLDINYGGDAALSVDVVVPERILGVEREVWECYSDRDKSRNYEGDHGCYGWFSEVVEKWRSGSVVKVWGEGHPNYIRSTKEIFDERLAPLLNLEFQWVDNKTDANFVATFLNPSDDNYEDEQARCGYCWGFGGPTSRTQDDRGGWSEVDGGAFTIFHIERVEPILNDYENLKPYMTGIILHEGLHALAPTGHGEPSSVIGVMSSSTGYLTYMDKAILALNSHPLVEPGMTMGEVRKLIVLRDELLDNPQEDFDLQRFLERTYATLRHAESMRMKLRGGWLDANCGGSFGYHDWAAYEISHFLRWGDGRDDSQIAYLREGGKSFFIFYSDEAYADDADGWQHWTKVSGSWTKISREQLRDSTNWPLGNAKLHRSLGQLLYSNFRLTDNNGGFADEYDVKAVDRSDGKITLEIRYDNPFIEWGIDETLEITLVVDESTYEVDRYTWTRTSNDRDWCQTYNEEVVGIKYGTALKVPEEIIEKSRYALPTEFRVD